MTTKPNGTPEYKDFDLSAIENKEKLPITMHGNHFLLGNAGFPSKEAFEEAFEKTEKVAEEFYKVVVETAEAGFLGEALELFESKYQKFNVMTRQICKDVCSSYAEDSNDKSKAIESYNGKFPEHGGGTIYEYMLLAKLMGQEGAVMTVHGPREKMLEYGGEENLPENVGRGEFVVKGVLGVKAKILEIEKKLGVKGELCLEREDLGNSDQVQAVNEEYKEFTKEFDRYVVSSHIMPKKNEENIDVLGDHAEFIDNNIADFLKVLKSDLEVSNQLDQNNEIPRELSVDLFVGTVSRYVDQIIGHMDRVGEAGDVLGHFDLIKLYMRRFLDVAVQSVENRDAVMNLVLDFREFSLPNTYNKVNKTRSGEVEVEVDVSRFVSDVLTSSEVFDKYKAVFNQLKNENKLTELNFAGTAKLVDLYGLDFIDVLGKIGTMVTIGSDSHNISDSMKFQKLFQEIRPRLITSNIRIVEPVFA